MPTVVHVVGARPNFIKMAPVIDALGARPGVRQTVVHTGQHYDARMSQEILSDLRFPRPDRSLGIGSGSHATQTARALTALEEVLEELRPDVLVVAGDVNSTLAAGLAAVKLGIDVAHVEAGLRSFDWEMPEEVNRVLTDRVSRLLFTHSPEAEANLAAEGITSGIHYVGNTMIDSLRRFQPEAARRPVWETFDVAEREYVAVTLHRPSNVDDPARLSAIARELAALAARAPVVFPVHPRTRARLDALHGIDGLERAGVRCIDPIGYLDFLSLELGAGALLTDSGGIQEEASAIGVPCFTLRANTERPVTIAQGTNVLLGDDPARIADVRLSGRPPVPCAIPLWDGHAGERIADVLMQTYAGATGDAMVGSGS